MTNENSQMAEAFARHSAADVIDRQSRQMTHLVDDLLDISRITRGKLALRMQPVKLREAIEAAIETSRPLIGARGHQLKVDIPEEDLKPKIFITGEVIRPGSYVVRQPTTLMQAIALAGGVGPFAAKSRIQVRRRAAGGDETIFMFNYKAYEAGLDLEGNIGLRTGDVIMVPERGLFD